MVNITAKIIPIIHNLKATFFNDIEFDLIPIMKNTTGNKINNFTISLSNGKKVL